MTKHKKYFQNMLNAHDSEFSLFKQLHDKYQTDQEKWQSEFNEKGAVVMEIIRDWEKKLCSHMEKGENAVFSSRVADKFWDEVRAYLPLIDFVGVEFS